jgi:uncharacterized protein (DUF927 family)
MNNQNLANSHWGLKQVLLATENIESGGIENTEALSDGTLYFSG